MNAAGLAAAARRLGGRVLAALATSALLVATAGAAEVRFTRVVPDGSGWSVEVAGLGKSEAPVFFADAVALPAAATAAAPPAGGEGRRFSLHALPAGTRFLGVGTANARGPAASVRVAALDPAAVPWAGWTVYHVMVEMFRNAVAGNDGEIRGWRHPNYAGGDLQGVREKLDYVRDLGATAIWLSPVFASRTSHGYDVGNYFAIGDQFAVPEDPVASSALFDALLADAHARGLAIVLDVPLNHAQKAYDKKLGDPKGFSPRATAARQEAEKTWDSWGAGFRYWDFEHPPTRAFLRDVARYWLVERRVDGLRLDYVRGVPSDFWAELRADVDAARPGAYLVGECWKDADGIDGNAVDCAQYYAPVGGRPQLPSLLDFPLQMALTDAFARGEPAAEVERWLQRTAALYGPDAIPSYFLDNHDMSRFAAWAGDADRLVAAVTFLAALSGPSVVFYGTETGLADGAPKRGFTDASRIPMPWDRLDQALRARVAAALGWRRQLPALGYGARLPLYADRDVVVMAKLGPADASGRRETVLVAGNVGERAREVVVEPGALASPAWRALGAAAAPRIEGERLVWNLPARSTVVAVAAAAGGP
jgi:cyclomaltodextrinase